MKHESMPIDPREVLRISLLVRRVLIHYIRDHVRGLRVRHREMRAS